MSSLAVTTPLLILLMSWAWQQDQQPRPPSTNSQGLLRINQEYFDLAASTGSDFYFWADGEFAAAALRFRSAVGGRPGHEGWFPLKRAIRKGETADCTASLSGTIASVEFAFVAKGGEGVAKVPMKSEGAGGDYHGRCTIRSVPFRAMVTGLDAKGAPFRRTESGLRSVS